MRWMWIDRIIEFEPEKRMVAVKSISLSEDHLHDHFPATDSLDAQPLMPATLIIEGMAQTAGILVGSVNGFTEKVILAKITGARLEAEVFPGQTIRFDATIERIDAGGASTTGTIERRTNGIEGEDWEPIGSIDLMFSHIDQNMAGVEFPEHNFVFSDNFKMILQSAGLEHLVR